MGKDRRQTTTTRLDPSTQGYVNQQRARANAGADMLLGQEGSIFADPRSVNQLVAEYMNPYMQQVIGATQQEFDQARSAAVRDANQRSTMAGSFGSRAAVERGARLGEIDRAQASTIGGLLSQGFSNALTQGLGVQQYQDQLRQQQLQEPFLRRMMANQLTMGAMGPYGQTSEQVVPRSALQDIAGIGLLAAGAMTGNPAAGGAGVSQFAGSGGFQAPSFLPQPRYNPLSRFGR